MNTEWAFEQYESVRAALPSAPFSAQFDEVETLTEVMDRFDVFLLDAFGVLNIGERAIPGAVELIADLRSNGKTMVVVSNSASVPTEKTLAKFHRFGFDFEPREIVTSRDALKAGLVDQSSQRWGVMATRESEIAELGVDAMILEDAPQSYEDADAFILLGSGEWTEARQSNLCEALTRNPRPVFVGNPDIVAPREDGLSLEPGFYAHDLACRTGCKPVFYGKPFGNIFDIVQMRTGRFDPDRTVMIGDTLHTDVLGGAAAGIKTVLLRDYGLFAGHDTTSFINRSGISPTLVASRL